MRCTSPRVRSFHVGVALVLAAIIGCKSRAATDPEPVPRPSPVERAATDPELVPQPSPIEQPPLPPLVPVVDCEGPPVFSSAHSTELRVSACSLRIEAGGINRKDLALAYWNRGVAYEHALKFNESISDFTEAIRLQPADASAFISRAGVRWERWAHMRNLNEPTRLEDLDLAIADLNKAIRLAAYENSVDRHRVDYRALALCNRSHIYSLKGDERQADADRREANRDHDHDDQRLKPCP